MWLAMGDYDSVTIMEMPDTVSMAALSMAVGGSGGGRAVKTTPLISMEESMEAMRKARGVSYQPPR
jgi:uncharacterized protein with GYD domain